MSRRSAEGFSLAEVVVALGILAGIMMSTAGLLVVGNRQVKSGRSSSEAVAVATDIMEELGGWGFEQLYARFGSDGAPDHLLVDTRSSTLTHPWQDRLEDTLTGTHATIRFDALDAARLSSARTVRVTVTIFWSEGLRPREVSLVTVRL